MINPQSIIRPGIVQRDRTRILLPCGIGDVYWSLVKLQDFCKRHSIEKPHVAIITTTPEIKYAGSEFRSLEFLKMIPFVQIDDPPNKEAYPIKPAPKWLSEIYMDMWHGTKSDYPGFMGYDHFVVYNGAITNGIFLEDVDDVKCDWYFPMKVSNDQEQFRLKCQKEYGRYALFLWSFCGGGYSDYHLKGFSTEQIAESTRQFVKKSGLTPVFVGAWWDTSHGNNHLKNIIDSVPNSVDLVGKTTVDQLFGVIKGSELVVGCHCGPTIMATVFHKKTIILWAQSYPLFKPLSPLVISPPDTVGSTYWPIYTDNLTVDEFVGKMLDLLCYPELDLTL